MKTYKLAELILNFDLYPRHSICTQHVSVMTASMKAGSEFPPIVVWGKNKWVIDGFHRITAMRRIYGKKSGDMEVECAVKNYRSEADAFADAIRYNASHGRALTTHDQTRCAILAKELGLTDGKLANAMHVNPDYIGELRVERTAKTAKLSADTPSKGNGVSVAVKRTIRHKAGGTITKEQQEVNDKLCGMPQAFIVNQLIMLIESDLIDKDDKQLMDGLKKLKRLLK